MPFALMVKRISTGSDTSGHLSSGSYLHSRHQRPLLALLEKHLERNHFYGELYCLKFCLFIHWRFLHLREISSFIRKNPAPWGCGDEPWSLRVLILLKRTPQGAPNPGACRTAWERLFSAFLWEVLHLSQLFSGCECSRVLKIQS